MHSAISQSSISSSIPSQLASSEFTLSDRQCRPPFKMSTNHLKRRRSGFIAVSFSLRRSNYQAVVPQNSPEDSAAVDDSYPSLPRKPLPQKYFRDFKLQEPPGWAFRVSLVVFFISACRWRVLVLSGQGGGWAGSFCHHRQALRRFSGHRRIFRSPESRRNFHKPLFPAQIQLFCPLVVRRQPR
ncbi:hypothetical protein Cgig2_012901 [Carnegiea gigantea]|uniref:Uncharacterized protein n=1 Tax=Carnegiea gigantea TaxID=171969 RepID=A0A9Q1GNB4_9CARY|nr:hypothetical protein Cgig2_012901 [Carnegiea gigantea]